MTRNPLLQIEADKMQIIEDSTSSTKDSQDRLSHHMLAILEKADGNALDLGTIFGTLSRRGHAVLFVFLSFPLCLPVGIPVLSTTLGLTLGFIGLLLALGREVWIPKFVATKVIPYPRLSYVIERLVKASHRMERWFHPRMPFIATSRRMTRIHGLFVMFLGVTASVPIPLPFNNFVAALPILLLGFSLLGRDGMLVIVSYLSSILCIGYYGALAYLGHAGFERLIGI